MACTFMVILSQSVIGNGDFSSRLLDPKEIVIIIDFTYQRLK